MFEIIFFSIYNLGCLRYEVLKVKEDIIETIA